MKRIFIRNITALLLCMISPTLWAAPPSQIQASYDVIGFGMTLANITETYTRTQDSYRLESVTTAIGLLARIKPETIRVTSYGKITPEGLMPLVYTLTRKVDTDKNASAKFNWEDNILTHIDYKGVNDMPLPKGTQDRLSLLYQLPFLAKSNQSQFTLSITDGNNLEKYYFSLSPEVQNIRVPLGTYKTRYFSNTPIGEEVKYELWMATEHDNFPCKIIVTDSSGGSLTQVLTQLTITP